MAGGEGHGCGREGEREGRRRKRGMEKGYRWAPSVRDPWQQSCAACRRMGGGSTSAIGIGAAAWSPAQRRPCPLPCPMLHSFPFARAAACPLCRAAAAGGGRMP